LASGTGGPIDSARREALCQTMAQKDFTASTLAGAWVVKTKTGFLVTRDKVAISGRKGSQTPEVLPVKLASKNSLIWDGRFKIISKSSSLQIFPAGGILQKLRQHTETNDIFSLPPKVRSTLPVYFSGNDLIGFGVGEWRDLSCQSLIEKRCETLWT